MHAVNTISSATVICLTNYEHSRCTQVTTSILESITRSWFCEWCIDSYMHKCAELCPSSVSSLLWDPSSIRSHDGLDDVICLQNTVSSIVKCRLYMSQKLSVLHFMEAQYWMLEHVSFMSLSLRLCLRWIDQLAETDRVLQRYFTAYVFLHVAYKTVQYSLKDEMLDVLATTCLQSNDARRCLNARHSSVLSLSQAAMLMNVVVNTSCSTVQLIQIELAKAYLHRALTFKDSDSSSVYCLANVYLAVLYYTTGHYQTAIDHCALVTTSQDHSQCSSHVVQGELLPHTDDQIDSSFGLAVFYQYVRAAAFNKEPGKRHVGVFTTELFAHYLHVKFLSVTKCGQISQTSLADEIWRYQNCFCTSPVIYATDMVLFGFANRTKYRSNDRLVVAYGSESKSFDTTKLVELLQQSAVEHLTTCREFEAGECNILSRVYVITDFKALYAYKCGQYRPCLQLSTDTVASFVDRGRLRRQRMVLLCPELIQLMDDDIVSVLGLVTLVNQSQEGDPPRFSLLTLLSLSLYLTTQCQIKLRHSVTSLAITLDYVQLARCKFAHINTGRISKYVVRHTGQVPAYVVDQPVLKFVEQKISKYMSLDH